MHKLVILIEPPADHDAFDDRWPEFLHLAEAMPGLRREATSRVERSLFGATEYSLMHELFFNSLNEAILALASETGEAAGRLLQSMTAGRMTLFLAAHQEDDLAHIQQHRPPQAPNV